MNFAVGIPTINRYDLLSESLEKYLNRDLPNTKIYVVDNGKQQFNISHPNLTILRSSKNLGVAGSWNVLLSLIYNNHDYAMILNDDIYLGKTERQINDLLKTPYDFYTTDYSWCSFILPKTTVDKIGVFDANFFPAYYEDNDYHTRMKLANLSYFPTKELSPEIFRTSMSVEKDPALNRFFDKNKERYIKKWGGIPHHETFKTPFNK